MALSEKGKKILVFTTVVAILGVGGYFGYKWWKKNKDKKGAGNLDNTDVTPPVIDETPVSPVTVSPFKSAEEIKAFQDWLDKTHPFWLLDKSDNKWKNLRTGTSSEPNRHLGGRGYGVYGTNTASAYARWGSEYKPSAVSVTTATATTIPENLKLVMSRLGDRAVYKKVDGNLYGVELIWQHSGRSFPFTFFDNNRFWVLNEGRYPLFKGFYSDGGRELRVTDDNWSKTSKVGTTFKTDRFWTTGEKLFTDKKA